MESSRPVRRRIFAHFLEICFSNVIVMALFKCICTVFGNIFFEKIVMTLFKSICTVFGNVLFEKFDMALFKSICTVFGDVFFDDIYGIG